DRAFSDLLRAGPGPAAMKEVLERCGDDHVLLVALLRRAVPLPFLELIASTSPWSEDHRLIASVVLSPRATRPLGLRLLGSLPRGDLAHAAASAAARRTAPVARPRRRGREPARGRRGQDPRGGDAEGADHGAPPGR